MRQYIVDAFTNKIFSGNPAAVCVMDQWPEEKWMMMLAAENNLSETAFIVKEESGYPYELKEIPVTETMEEAFGSRPIKAVLGLDLVCVFENDEIVRDMNPDQNLLIKMEGRYYNCI